MDKESFFRSKKLSKFDFCNILKVYLNPENPRDIRTSNQYRMEFFATFLVFASISIIALIVAIIVSFL